MLASPRSASTRTTREPRSPSAIARFNARFDVPTPPLPLVRTIDRVAGPPGVAVEAGVGQRRGPGPGPDQLAEAVGLVGHEAPENCG